MHGARLMMIAGCLAMLAGAVWADGASPPDRLTLDDCTRIALERNPVRTASAAAVTAARKEVAEAKAPYYPGADFGTGYSRWQRHAFLPADLQSVLPVDVIGPTDDWFLSLNAHYTLFDSGARRAGLRGARAMETAALAADAASTQTLVTDVETAFFRVMGARAELEAAKKNRERAAEHLRLARERKAVGAVPLLDVLRAEVEVSNAELAVIDAEDRRRVAQGVLNTLMGQPPEQDLELAAPAAPVVNPAEIPLADAVARALAQRPETQSAAARMDATRARISQAKSAFGPRLTGEGMFGWHDDEFAPSDQEWALGMSIRIPIFTGFANENRLGKAKAEFNQAEAEAAGLGLAIRREVWTAYSMLQRNYAAVMTADVQAQQAAESLRLARERYALGAGTITDLLDAQTALTRAESLQARTRWEYHVARSEFRRVTAAVNVPAASAP